MSGPDWVRLIVFIIQQAALIAALVMTVGAHSKWKKASIWMHYGLWLYPSGS